MDILAANATCFALYDGVFECDRLPLNLARFLLIAGVLRVVYSGEKSLRDTAVVHQNGVSAMSC